MFIEESANIPFSGSWKFFHPSSVGFAFVLNLAEGVTSINLLSNPVST